MDSKQIRFLLDQYFEGQTTRKEELLIRRFYLENKNLETDLEKFRALFLYFNHAKKEPFPTKQVGYKFMIPYAIAASFLILGGLFLTQKKATKTAEESVDHASVQKAYNDFKSNFTQLSKHWEKGTASVQYLDYWDQTTKEFIKE